MNGVRISACRDDEVLGYIELDTDPADGGRLGQLDGWADVGNLHVVEPHRRRGIATWLVGRAADWLRLARVERLLDYAWPNETDRLALSHRLGFRELTRTARLDQVLARGGVTVVGRHGREPRQHARAAALARRLRAHRRQH